jgi:hypothetical protein
MTQIEIENERKELQAEYNALKKHLGEMLLEHNAQEDNPEDFKYFSRKFEEARKKLRR